jgi:hypothetical protein
MKMATVLPDNQTKKAVLAIKAVKYFKSKKTGKYYLVIIFTDSAWIEYMRLELYFRLVSNINQELPIHRFANVPTSIEGDGLLVLMEGELEGLCPEKINILAPPPMGDEYIKEHQLRVLNET